MWVRACPFTSPRVPVQAKTTSQLTVDPGMLSRASRRSASSVCRKYCRGTARWACLQPCNPAQQNSGIEAIGLHPEWRVLTWLSRVSNENHPYGHGLQQEMVKREPVFASRNLCECGQIRFSLFSATVRSRLVTNFIDPPKLELLCRSSTFAGNRNVAPEASRPTGQATAALDNWCGSRPSRVQRTGQMITRQ